jgi:hypothetical protein
VTPQEKASQEMTSQESAAELELEVKSELELVESSSPFDGSWPASPWAYDPADAIREEIGLRNLLGAAESLAAQPLAEPVAQPVAGTAAGAEDS